MIHFAPDGEFFAFEPLPDLYQILVQKFAASNVRIYDLALSDIEGQTEFYHSRKNPGFSGMMRRLEDQEAVFTVRMAPLDNIIPDQQRIDLVKVDVEGAELQVFRGAARTICRWRPIVLFEHGVGGADFYGTKPEQVFEVLVDVCGLRISLVDHWLREGDVLTKKQFSTQFYERTNFFFIAHP